MIRAALTVIFAFIATSAMAQTISLGMPIACNYGVDCFIQKYVDHDTTTGHQDYHCGRLANDRHNGTDFRLLNEGSIVNNVPVLAAADGVVRGRRDGMDDVNVMEIDRALIRQRECGNSVVIKHATGYETQYCHMKKGSVRHRSGEPVKAGDVIGYVGLSGMTAFPHVHFIVRRLGRVYDPFTGEPMGTKCGGQRTPFWKPEVAKKLAYIPTALLSHGFHNNVPKPDEMRKLSRVPVEFARSEPALVYWVDVMGPLRGDIVTLSITGPNNTLWAEKRTPMTKPLAQHFGFVGKKATPEGLVPGVYRARITIERAGKIVLERETNAVVRL